METERIGLNHATRLSYEAIDNSNLSYDERRNLIFSFYSFRCLFDNHEMTYINPVLTKYNCTFSCKLTAHPHYDKHKDEFEIIRNERSMYIPYGGLYVEDDGEYKVRYDVGSPVWQEFMKQGKIEEAAAQIPEKYDLYELVLIISSLNTATTELRAMWYLMFFYVILLEAPHDNALYSGLKALLVNEEVFKAVLETTYSLYTVNTVSEMQAQGFSRLAIDWMRPYIEWKNDVCESGVMREVERFQKWLAAGRFEDAFKGSEKLLDSFPDDENLLLVNIAARTSLDKEITQNGREKMQKETIALIESALTTPKRRKELFHYYHGLALLGLKEPQAAAERFRDCLEENQSFQPAALMLKALEKHLSD